MKDAAKQDSEAFTGWCKLCLGNFEKRARKTDENRLHDVAATRGWKILLLIHEDNPKERDFVVSRKYSDSRK